MIKVCAIQASFSRSYNENIKKAIYFLEEAANHNVNIALLPELFENEYFCYQENDLYFKLATSVQDNPTIKIITKIAKKFRMVIPVSFFEKDGPHYYNSVAMIDADGRMLGIYRKTHIPHGYGYNEKYYFKPGNTGFKVWKTKYAIIGLGICWDQWFPEVVRAFVLKDADLVLYPTAIGSEPQEIDFSTKDPWQKAMMGHSICNIVPIVAANRIGNEHGKIFYGHSLIIDQLGNKIAELNNNKEGIISAIFNKQEIKQTRASFGFFRDRISDKYKILIKK